MIVHDPSSVRQHSQDVFICDLAITCPKWFSRLPGRNQVSGDRILATMNGLIPATDDLPSLERMTMDVLWGIEAIKAGAQHKEEIASGLRRGWEYFFGKRVSIAFTGMQGVGKTVLLHHLTGEAFKPDYQRPRQSEREDSGTIKSGKGRIQVTTIPGQKSNPRYVTLDKIFSEEDPVQGVVHVVSWGYPTIRTPEAKDVLLHDRGATTIEKLRGVHLKDEEDDFTETCQYIRASHHKTKAPAWLILAVDKVDLYADKVEKAREWYGHAAGFFTKKLQEMERQLGADYFRWAILPVCACLESFEWNGEVIPPKIDDQGRAAYLAQLHRYLANFCHG